MSLTTLDGRYHVVERIASGGMGDVFRARDAVLAREVAVKVLHRTLAGDPGFIDRFRREARAAASLNHPNIVAVYDWGANDGIYFMVMEFVSGRSVRELLSAHGRLEPAQAAEVLLQVLAALDHAHGQGIVHRDVKPENIILTRDGVAKVADFGLARAYADSRVTQAGAVAGTVQYLAPEQVQGEPADPRTDLYSLGIVAYELLTGRVPFNGETSLAIAYKHVRDRVPRPSLTVPSIPEGLDGWVASCTEKERELRPESAAEARRDLGSEARSLPAAQSIGDVVRKLSGLTAEPDAEGRTTVTIQRPLRPRERRRRTRRRVAGALLAILAAVGAAYGAWRYLVPHYTNVPNVLEISLDQARDQLNQADLTWRVAKGLYSVNVPRGDVLKADPSVGVRVRTGTIVRLVPSLGPPPVNVPNLVGKTIPQAKAALAQANLSLGNNVTYAYDELVPADRIVRQSRTGKAPERSAIDVTVSKGPRPVPVPKVVGLREQKAALILSRAGFDVTKQTDYSDTVPLGRVISQAPAPKHLFQPGKTVTITVSLGPETFPLPSFVGMSKDQAVAAIRGLHLVPQVLPVPGGSGDTVVSQLPQPGVTVHVGDTITIYVA